MTKQAQAKISALIYAAIPLATALAVKEWGLDSASWDHILAAVAAFAAIFGVNVATGDKTAAVGSGPSK